MAEGKDPLEPEHALATLQALHQASVSLHPGASPAELYEEAVDAVVTAVGVDRASLLLFDADGVMRGKAWRGLSDPYRSAVEGHTPWGPEDPNAGTLAIPDVAADPNLAALQPALAAEGVAAVAFVPLLRRGGVLGTFVLHYDRVHEITAAELAVAEVLAAQVAATIEWSRADEALRRSESTLAAAKAVAEASAARLGVLARVTASLSTAISERDVANVVLRAACNELGADNVSLCLLRGDELEIAYASGYTSSVVEHWHRFPLAADLPASESVRRNEPVFIHSPEELGRRYPIFTTTPVLGDEAFAVFPLGGEHPFGCLVVGFAQARTLDDADGSFLFELAGRCSVALVRARLYDERERARLVAEQARAQVNLLARVSAALSRSLDYDVTAGEVAAMMVAEAVDGCAVIIFEEGRPRAAALRHRRADRMDALRETAERVAASIAVVERPNPLDASGPVPGANGDAPPPFRLPALMRPLRARGKVLGALVLVVEPGATFAEETGAVADEVAARMASAIENGRLFKERTLIAQTLQASLLPPELPEIPGVDLAARHVAAGAGVEVGGDFYDVFRLDSRRFVLVLGDVCGRGVGAASLAALCRHTVRSAVVNVTDPAAILAHVNEVLLRQSVDAYEPRFCTAVVAVGSLEDDGVTIRLALGGHPPPLVRRADGAVERAGIPGFLLGVRADAPATDALVRLGPGDALICVTDGVLERRRPGAIFGDDGLAAAVRQAPAGSAMLVSTAVESAVLSFSDQEAGDDLAVLVVHANAPAPAPAAAQASAVDNPTAAG